MRGRIAVYIRGIQGGTCQVHFMLELDQHSATRVRLKCLARSIRYAYFPRSQKAGLHSCRGIVLVLLQRPRREAPGRRFQMFTAFHRIRPNHGSCRPHRRKRSHEQKEIDTYVLKKKSPFQRGEGGTNTPPHPLRHRISYANDPILNPTSKYIIKRQGGYIRDTQPPGREQQPAHQLRTAQSNGEKGREQERVVTMSTASTGKGPLLQPSVTEVGPAAADDVLAIGWLSADAL